MIEMFLDRGFLVFDGQVVEFFGEKIPGKRLHVRYLEKIELSEGRKGGWSVSLRDSSGGGLGGWSVPAEHVDQAHQFIAAVQAAMDAARGG